MAPFSLLFVSFQYIRLSDATSVERISILLREVWGLKLPKLLVSIVGGNKENSIPGKILSILGNGLAKVL